MTIPKNSIINLRSDLLKEKVIAKDAVSKFKNVNDEYHGFYKGKVEVYVSCIQKLDLLLNSNKE